ncbi:11133_t:CDS:2, partial [Acaulospora colombiana]
INPPDLIRRNKKNSELPSRATNKDVSRMAAMAWKNEPRKAKRKYEDIAREVEMIHDNGCVGSTPTNASVKSSSLPSSVSSVSAPYHHRRNNPSTSIRYTPYGHALAPHATVRSQQHDITRLPNNRLPSPWQCRTFSK